jgi:hypothetical protein
MNEHLKSAIEEQEKLISEINELNNIIITKKESALKLQGIIEYLTQMGAKVVDKDNDLVEDIYDPKQEI